MVLIIVSVSDIVIFSFFQLNQQNDAEQMRALEETNMALQGEIHKLSVAAQHTEKLVSNINLILYKLILAAGQIFWGVGIYCT